MYQKSYMSSESSFEADLNVAKLLYINKNWVLPQIRSHVSGPFIAWYTVIIYAIRAVQYLHFLSQNSVI